jgi:hypothetical protein
VRRPVLVAGLLGIAAALARRLKAQRAERDLWTEATTASGQPDLR